MPDINAETQEFYVNFKQDAAWYMHRLHFHGSLELLLAMSEGGEILINREMYPLHPNTLLVLPPNTLHLTRNEEGRGVFRRYVFHLLPSLVERLSTKQTDFAAILRGAPPYLPLDKKDAARLIELFEQLRTPPTVDTFGSDILQQILLQQSLLLVCGFARSGTVRTGVSNPDYEKVQPILVYIQQHYTSPLTLDDLARFFLVSRHYLCHIFKKGTGFSVMEYVIQLRIIEAQRLLRGGCSVQQASEESGFQSYAHFIRTFNTYTGTSPKQYAMQYKNADKDAPGAQAFKNTPDEPIRPRR